MKVFISWSGERSRQVAEGLNNWLKEVLQFTKPFFSPEDIDAGAPWSEVIRQNLEESDFAILCVTQENARSEWINFEAGACSKKGNSRVVPYLLDVPVAQLRYPLATFNAVSADAAGTRKLLDSLNKAKPDNQFESATLDRLFKRNWSELEEVLAKVPPLPDSAKVERRSPEDMFAEILGHLRTLGRPVSDTHDPLPFLFGIANNSVVEKLTTILKGYLSELSENGAPPPSLTRAQVEEVRTKLSFADIDPYRKIIQAIYAQLYRSL